MVRLHDPVPVAEPEVDHAVGSQHPANLVEHRVGVHDVLVDVVEHHHVDGRICEGESRAVGGQQVGPVELWPRACAGEGSGVDVDADAPGAGGSECLEGEAGGAPEVEDEEPVELVEPDDCDVGCCGERSGVRPCWFIHHTSAAARRPSRVTPMLVRLLRLVCTREIPRRPSPGRGA